jgi:ribosomal protein S4
MARYTGPKSKIARRFKDPIFGPDKALDKKAYGPGQHGPNKRRGAKTSEYGIQLNEKQMDDILKEIKGVVKNWKTEATKIGISKAEITLMNAAFKF